MASTGTTGGGGFASGAAKGAGVGAYVGPVGMVAGALIGGYFSNKASKRAAKTQSSATHDAMDYQKGQDEYQHGRDALADKHYDDAWQDYLKRHAAWEQRNAKGTPTMGGGGGSRGFGSGASLSDIAALSQGSDPKAAVQADGSLADIASGAGQWNDWRRYGL